MKVKTATFLFAALIFGLFALLGFSLIKMTTQLEREAKDLTVAAESIRLAKELKSALQTHNRNEFLHSLHREPDRLADNEFLQTKITRLLTTMEQLTGSGEERFILAELKTDAQSYFARRQWRATLELSAMEEFNAASKDVERTFTAIENLIGKNQSRMDSRIEGIRHQNILADWVGFLLLSLGCIVLLSLMGIMFFYIVRPLRNVAETISTFSSGNTSARVEPGGLTEIRQISSNFNSMADRLEQKQREQLHFIAAIAHDLRNPLNSMSMASELLAHKDNQEDQKSVDLILRQVKNLDRMVGDLLDTARIEAGHLDLKFASHDIDALIMDSVQLHRTSSRAHHFNIEMPDSLVWECDGGRITQVMNNLISNATKYSPNGGIVTVRARREGSEIVISVNDQGIGIAPENIDDIFKPFNRTDVTRGTIPGIGLGLSVSRHIVEAHGGRFRVKSKPGAGSTFEFSLPAKTLSPVISDEQNASLLSQPPIATASTRLADQPSSQKAP